MFDGMPSWYDDWKTACCERYPDCSNCPYDEHSQSREEYEDAKADWEEEY
jgi:hypothetical protein